MNPQYVDVLQWLGAISSMIGALLVASPYAHIRRKGFFIWLVSNQLLIMWALITHAWGIALMQVFFLATSYRGWYNNK